MPQGVRRLGADDVADYRAIRLASLALEPAFFGTLHADESRRPIAHFAATLAEALVFGATVDGALAGLVRLHAGAGVKERHKGSVNGFFVLPAHRRKGLGSALMSAAIEVARESLEQLTLSVVATNTHAIALYERIGFERYGLEPRARKYEGAYADVVLMVLPLRP